MAEVMGRHGLDKMRAKYRTISLVALVSPGINWRERRGKGLNQQNESYHFSFYSDQINGIKEVSAIGFGWLPFVDQQNL